MLAWRVGEDQSSRMNGDRPAELIDGRLNECSSFSSYAKETTAGCLRLSCRDSTRTGYLSERRCCNWAAFLLELSHLTSGGEIRTSFNYTLILLG